MNDVITIEELLNRNIVAVQSTNAAEDDENTLNLQVRGESVTTNPNRDSETSSNETHKTSVDQA